MNAHTWPLAKLRDVCEKPQYGFTASAANESVGPRFLRITDLSDGSLNWAAVPFCVCPNEEAGKFRLRTGDLVVARIGATTGRASLIVDPPEAVFASYLIRLRPTEKVNPHFLFFFTRSHEYQSWIAGNKDNNLKGGVNASLLSEIEVSLPPIEEQRKIASILRKVQHVIEVEEKLIATARELKQAAIRQLFTCGLRGGAVKATDYGDLPQTWKTRPLGDCSVVQTGATKGRKISMGDALEVPYLRVANVQDGHLDLREMKTITIRKHELENYLLRDGDVVLTEGGDFDKLGRGFIWRGQVPNCVHQNHVFAVRTNREVLLPEFLAYLAQSPYGRSYFLTVAHKTTNLACINSTKLKAFPVPLPPVADQHQIGLMLQQFDKKVSVHEHKLVILQELFKTLLRELMTGQIRVNHLDIDVSCDDREDVASHGAAAQRMHQDETQEIA